MVEHTQILAALFGFSKILGAYLLRASAVAGLAPGGTYTDNAIGRLGVHLWNANAFQSGECEASKAFHMLTNPEAHKRLVQRENIIPGRRES